LYFQPDEILYFVQDDMKTPFFNSLPFWGMGGVLAEGGGQPDEKSPGPPLK
jgi:hypothetical protein